MCINLYQSIDLHNDQPPVDLILIAQLVEHCTGIAEVRVQITIQALLSHQCLKWYCDENHIFPIEIGRAHV